MSEPVGIIYPPPELRGIVDSTAKYVAKNGEKFEEKIKKEHRDKPKFSFLLPGDPFNAYYQHKVKEIRAQLLGNLDSKPSDDPSTQPQKTAIRDDDASQEPQIVNNETQHHNAGTPTEERNQDQQDHQQTVSNNEDSHGPEPNSSSTAGPRMRSKLNEYIQEMTVELEEQPPLNYLAQPAPNLNQMDCDIIKLTAQYIATHGRSFLLELVSREQTNSQFDFLKPQHGQFSYMTNLIMQYALVQNQPLDILEQLTKDATSQKHVFERIKMRAEWNRMLETERKKLEEAREKEKLLYSQIDWHDFVIKETIDYQPDEKGEYPPTTADQVGTRLLLQQRYEEQNVPEEMEIDMDMDSDQDEDVGESRGISDNGSGGEFVNPNDLERVVIRKDYDPKSNTVKPVQVDNYFISPITNERIPVDKIHEHVRYNLADPRYLEKKDQMLQERINEETVFASGSQIQNSLKSLAERRTDIFGMNDRETAIGMRIGEEEQEQQPKDDRTIWDGHKSSLKKKKKLG